MSRIGKLPIDIPKGTEVTINNNVVTVKGVLGTLTQVVDPLIKVESVDSKLVLTRGSEDKEYRSKHGLYRALIANMVEGVSKGFKVQQELVGVGYKASNQGQLLELTLGYSHLIVFELPKEIKVETVTERGKNPVITLSSYDKALLGQVAAKVRSLRKPEPFKGKGIKFVGEQLRRKAGKSAGK